MEDNKNTSWCILTSLSKQNLLPIGKSTSKSIFGSSAAVETRVSVADLDGGGLAGSGV